MFRLKWVATGEKRSARLCCTVGPRPTNFITFSRAVTSRPQVCIYRVFFFARLDIKSFFDNVTRSKVYRALRRLGFSHRRSWGWTFQSVVSKPGLSGFSLPFGFVQSPILASIVLDHSQLGITLRHAGNVRVSVYVDDILLSCCDETELAAYVDALHQAAAASGFALNSGAKQQLGREVEVFNLTLAQGAMQITDARMQQFESVERSESLLREHAIVAYAASINPTQAEALRKVYGL